MRPLGRVHGRVISNGPDGEWLACGVGGGDMPACRVTLCDLAAIHEG